MVAGIADFNRGILRKLPLLDYLAATSVGLVEDELLLDLAYEEDSAAQVDMNVVMTGSGHFVEVQASAEGRPYTDVELSNLLKLADFMAERNTRKAARSTGREH